MMKHIFFILLFNILIFNIQAQEIYSLEKCKELALENNVNMKKASLEVESASYTRKEAYTNYFPVVSAAGGVFKADKGIVGLSLEPLFPDTELSFVEKGVTGGVTAVVPVFMGGQIINGNKLAQLGEEVSRYQLQQTSEQVIVTVEQYYWQLVSLREKQKTIEIVEKLVDKTLKDVSLAVQVEVTNRNDLLQVQLKKNSINSTKLQLENGIHISKMVLAQYIGVNVNDFDIAAPAFGELQPPAFYYTDHSEALPNTISYKLLDKNVEASKLQQKIAVGKYLPMADVGAGYVYHNLIDGDRAFGAVFATLSIPISKWWGGSHAIKKQKQQVKIAEYDRQNAHELLLIQMQKLYNDLEEYYNQVAISKESIEKAEENLRLNTDYYGAGTVTMNDLLDAQNLLQQSRDQYTTDYTNYLMKITQYLQATAR